MGNSVKSKRRNSIGNTIRNEKEAHSVSSAPQIVWVPNCETVRRLCAAEVGAFAGVDADFFAFVDEGRDLDDETGFEFGRLGDAGGCGGLDAGLGFDDGELDSAGQVDADGHAVEVADLDLQVGRQVFNCVAESGLLEHHLLVVFRVHEVVVV